MMYRAEPIWKSLVQVVVQVGLPFVVVAAELRVAEALPWVCLRVDQAGNALEVKIQQEALMVLPLLEVPVLWGEVL